VLLVQNAAAAPGPDREAKGLATPATSSWTTCAPAPAVAERVHGLRRLTRERLVGAPRRSRRSPDTSTSTNPPQCPREDSATRPQLRHVVVARRGCTHSAVARADAEPSRRRGSWAATGPRGQPCSDLDGGAADAADLELLSPPPGDRHEEHRDLSELPYPRPWRGVAAARAGADLSGAQVLLLGAEAEEEEHVTRVGSRSDVREGVDRSGVVERCSQPAGRYRRTSCTGRRPLGGPASGVDG
jgi:hypothetical protein